MVPLAPLREGGRSNHDIDELAQPHTALLGRRRSGRRLRRSHLFQRQGRKAVYSTSLAQGGREIGLWRGLRLRHLQAGARLTGGLLGGDQSGADLHRQILPKQG